jgi:hypothetical protein
LALISFRGDDDVRCTGHAETIMPFLAAFGGAVWDGKWVPDAALV